MSERPIAYNVWICGECDSHTIEKNNGDHQCETCGSRYDHQGIYIPDEDDELDGDDGGQR